MQRALEEPHCTISVGSPTLVELLTDCDSFRKEDSSSVPNRSDDPAHSIIHVEALHVKPVRFVLAFNNLEYKVTSPRWFDFSRRRPRSSNTVKTLLDDVSGEACDGNILAVLGASGAGKSTLIDALAGRVAKESLRGSVTLNGENVLQSQLLKVISAYVMQDDLLFPMLTVKETLMFASEFRLPRSFPKSKKMERVQAVIDQLGLRNAEDTVIGDEGHRGVSGGERRRVSIGIDIIHDPIVLFLDEPTSGLDSTSAFMVVKVLKRIAQSGSIVVMSIHQPSTRIIELLDRLIILSQGKNVFSGSPASLPHFLSKLGHTIPEKENIIEFALDLVPKLEGSTEGTRELVEFNEKWQLDNLGLSQSARATPQGLSLKEAIIESVSRGKLVSGSSGANLTSTETVSSYTNPSLFETFILAKRYMKNWIRMPELLGTRIAIVMVTAFLLATVYWKLDNTPKGAQERLTFFAFIVPTTFYLCLDNVPVFIQERYIFLRETTRNAYRTSSYVMSHSLVSLPQLIAPSLVFSSITFWTVGLRGGLEGFVFYCLIIYASFWSGSSVVTFISGLVPHIMLSYMVTIAYVAYCLLLSGFYVVRDRIPSYWIWFHYISPVKYPYEAVLINEFDDPSRCFVKGVQVFDGTLLGGVSDVKKVELLETLSTSLSRRITQSTCLKTGYDLLTQQGITQLSKWDCLWITLASGLFFRILFYFALLFGSKNKRT
ncbi:ABC transporter G family member 19 [Raphanus sativus]|uniref:ABC transporter G family member 19-like n=1 Tax=Raphanus sativus TaxID=3726 RepID=A0A6J0NJU3_RAPSA|nr:ABC transporter G family member 19-like [Raphanus sativus]KAJ4902210.1 ABC transporter G family member 19 [Raphanus sativus]